MPKRPAPKTEPKPELVYEIEGAPPKVFVIRHKPSRTWWGPDEAGYTGELARAGTYSEERARLIESRRGEDEAVALDVAAREYVTEHFTGGNPVVLAAIAALGGR